nr:PREDICTED: deoxyribonuclease-1-like isoform X2 [Latimeria chalumnae]|eukprot:XP_014347824.1 PREDICTED: deoxyribonuclease-1-like isoform X2 [Latimeria chalumnae]
MDEDNTPITELVMALNDVSGVHYNFIISSLLGRSSYKEKYGFVFNEAVLKPTDWYYYNDGCENCGTDTFIREPFIVRFSSLPTVLKDFALISIHTSPDYAVREVDALYDVWEDAKHRFKTENIMILGDFNADCNYIKTKDWPNIRLRQSPSLHWLIGDDEDTTVSGNTNCAYDRIVVSGSELIHALIPGTAKTFNFQDIYDLSYYQTKDVSDHYPVEVELRLDSGYFGKGFQLSSSIGIPTSNPSAPCDCIGINFSSCRGRCSAYSQSFPCNCNAACSKYDSCCSDYQQFCSN